MYNLNACLLLPGHSGAAQLWSNIRNHSNRKLLREDQKIPDTLKVGEISKHIYFCVIKLVS